MTIDCNILCGTPTSWQANRSPSDFDQQDLHRAICWSQRGHQPVWASHPRQVTDTSSLLQKDATHFLLLTPTPSNLILFFSFAAIWLMLSATTWALATTILPEPKVAMMIDWWYIYYDGVSVCLCVTKNHHFRVECQTREARRWLGLAGRRPALA